MRSRTLFKLSAFVLVLCSLVLTRPSGAIELLIKRGSTTSPIPFALMDAGTGQIGQAGQTGAAVGTPVSLTGGVGGNITVTIWQAGGSGYIAATGTVTERGNGIYHYTPVAADTSNATASDNLVLLHITCPGCQTYDTSAEVVAFDPNDATRLGLAALPNILAGGNGGLPLGNALGQVTVGGYALNEDPAYLLLNSNLLGSVTNWATGSLGYWWERTIGADWGGYTRNPASGVITFTMPNGQTVTATISVNASGQITGRVTN